MGLRTALISNCSPDVPELWPTTPYVQLIDEPLFSCVERLVKPDSNLYLRAWTRLGVGPEDCVYVGDGGDHELTGAARGQDACRADQNAGGAGGIVRFRASLMAG